MGLGEMGLGEMVLGEMILGDMDIHRCGRTSVTLEILDRIACNKKPTEVCILLYCTELLIGCFVGVGNRGNKRQMRWPVYRPPGYTSFYIMAGKPATRVLRVNFISSIMY
jgi:hypothetical protein